MRASARWSVAILVVVLAILVGLVLELRGGGDSGDSGDSGVGRAAPAGSGRAPGQADLVELRARAGLPPCPPADAAADAGALRNVTVQCLADGESVQAGPSTAGRTVLLNLWAYWCGPCVDELPAMMEYQRRVGGDVTVVTVHQDPDAAAGLSMLADLGVRLPAWQDGDRRVAAALRVPNVMPASVLLRPDGSVAAILPRAFANADEIAAAVDERIGARR